MSRGGQCRWGVLLIVVPLLALAACGGGGSSGGTSAGGGDETGSAKNAGPAPDGAVASQMQPQLNGWAFPNFPSATFPDLNFDAADLVSMFGSGAAVCVDGVAEPCTLTAEAAAWARMVNQARATGHCEGLVALASARFNKAELPETVKLPSQEEEIRAVMRAFATQFLPEVQESIQKWTKASLKEKVDELKRSFASDKLEYTLGVYVEGGGHAVLPYAIEYPTPDVARIMVYDSNWPGRNRYVDVDLANDEWSFSFASDDPAADPNIWSGGAGDMDLTPFEAREGTCPFCGDGTTLQSTTLLVRTENLEWSVETSDGQVSPTQPASTDGVAARPVKGAVLVTRLAPRAGIRSSYDYVITIPNSLLEGEAPGATTTAATDGPPRKKAKLNFGGASSVFAVMKTGVAQFTTPGGASSEPVEIGTTSIKSNDPGVDLTLASGNLVANASGPSVELGASDGGALEVAVTTASGEVIQQEVTPEAPALQVKADESGTVQVLQATASGEVQKTDIAADGTKTQTVVEAAALNLNKVEVELPPTLASKAIEALPKLEDRNLNNPTYKADEAYVAPTTTASPVAAGKEVASGVTSTVPKNEAPSTVQTRNAALPNVTTTTAPARPGSSPTTIVARSVTAAGATPTTVLAVVKPNISNFRITAKTFGDDAFTLDPPDSNSPGGFRYTSSKTDVATVSATTGRVTIVGAGSTVIAATQSAARGFEAGIVSATLLVTKAKPTIASIKDITKTFGDEPFTIKDPISDSSGAISYSTSNDSVIKQSRTTGRWVIGGAGKATITVVQAATDDHLAASDSFVVTVRKGSPVVKAPADVSKSFLDTDFEVPRPTSESKGVFTYASSDTNIVSLADGKASIKAAGTVTITATQAATDDWLATTTTFKIIVSPKAPSISEFGDTNKVFGDATFTLSPPKSESSGAFTYKSSDEKVVTVGSTDGKVTVVGAGIATVTASQAATSGFSAGSISARITVAKADPGLSDLLITDRAYGGDDFVLKPSAKSSGTFTYSTDKSDIFMVDAQTGSVKIVGVGTATLTASIASTTNHEAGSVSASVTVAKGTPKITWSLGNKTFGAIPFTLVAPTSTSGGSFSYSVSSADAATLAISGNTATILKAGIVTVVAKQAATALWNEGSTSTTLTIDKAVPVLSAFTIPTKTFGNAPFSLTAPTSTVSQSVVPFIYEIVSPPSSVATLTSNVVTITGVGTVQIRARQDASTNHTAASITATLTVNGVTPTVSWACVTGGSCSGLKGTRYVGYFNDAVNWFTTATKHGDTNQLADFSRFSSSPSFNNSVENYSWEWIGWFKTTTAGSYTFCTDSDDASYVWLGATATSGFTTGNSLVNNGGAHGMQVRCGTTASLTAQTSYPIRVQFGERTGGDEMRMYFTLPDSPTQIFNGTSYFRAAEEVTKTEGDAPFVIQPPTSNSPGAFVYSSSNPEIASIHPTSGLVTPLTPGVVTFTANQAASGTWATGSATAQLTVAARPPAEVFPAQAGGVGSDLSSALLPLSDGSMIVIGTHVGPSVFGSTTLSGRVDPASPSDYLPQTFLARVSALGNWAWAENFSHGSTDLWGYPSGSSGGEVGALAADVFPDDSIVIAGRFGGTLTLGSTVLTTSCASGELFVAKMNSARSWQWAAQSGGCAYNAYPLGVAVGADGGVYVSGNFAYAPITLGSITLSSSSARGFVARLSPSGSWSWAKPIVAGCDELRLEVDDAGDVYAYGTCGLFNSNIWTDYEYREGQSNALVTKLDSSGTFKWQTTVTSPSWVRSSVKGLRVLSDGSLVIAGTYGSGTVFDQTTMTNHGMYVAKLSSSGAWQWVSTGGARNQYDTVAGLAIQANGTIVVAAIYQQWGTPTYGTYTLTSSDHQRDIALLKLGPGGTWTAAERIGNISSGWSATEDAIDVEVLSNGKIVLLANFSSTNLSVGTSTVSTAGSSDILLTTW